MSGIFVLCADDYGLSEPISRAILDLAEHGRISAVSCMTASPIWREHGARLRALTGRIDIGLHVTLVDEAPLTAMPRLAPAGRLPGIGSLIARAYARTLPCEELAAEMRAQIDAFTEVVGAAPSHIDGHLHAHVLPGIRQALVAATAGFPARPWFRDIGDRAGRIMRRGVAVPKALFLSLLARGTPTPPAAMNEGFSGLYDLARPGQDYAALFERFLMSRGAKHLVLCHPGGAADTAAGAASREIEYRFFAGPAFNDCLARHNIQVGRFTEAR